MAMQDNKVFEEKINLYRTKCGTCHGVSNPLESCINCGAYEDRLKMNHKSKIFNIIFGIILSWSIIFLFFFIAQYQQLEIDTNDTFIDYVGTPVLTIWDLLPSMLASWLIVVLFLHILFLYGVLRWKSNKNKELLEKE